jgi:hypothetical protein
MTHRSLKISNDIKTYDKITSYTDHYPLYQIIKIDGNDVLLFSVNFAQQNRFNIYPTETGVELSPFLRNETYLYKKIDRNLQKYTNRLYYHLCKFVTKHLHYKVVKIYIKQLKTYANSKDIKDVIKILLSKLHDLIKKEAYNYYKKKYSKYPKLIREIYGDIERFKSSGNLQSERGKINLSFNIEIENIYEYKRRAYLFLREIKRFCKKYDRCLIFLQEIKPLHAFVDVLSKFKDTFRLVGNYSNVDRSKTILLQKGSLDIRQVDNDTITTLVSRLDKKRNQFDNDKNTKYHLTTKNREKIYFYNIHGDYNTVNKQNFWKNFERRLDKIGRFVVLGDFNISANPSNRFKYPYISVSTPAINFFNPCTTKDFIITKDVIYSKQNFNLMQNIGNIRKPIEKHYRFIKDNLNPKKKTLNDLNIRYTNFYSNFE